MQACDHCGRKAPPVTGRVSDGKLEDMLDSTVVIHMPGCIYHGWLIAFDRYCVVLNNVRLVDGEQLQWLAPQRIIYRNDVMDVEHVDNEVNIFEAGHD